MPSTRDRLALAAVLAISTVTFAATAMAQPEMESNDRFVAYIGADAYQFSPLHKGELATNRLFAVFSHPDAAVRGELGDVLWRLEISGPDQDETVVRVERGRTALDPQGMATAEVLWDGADQYGNLVAPGMYHYTFRARFRPDLLGPWHSSADYENADIRSEADEAYASSDDIVVNYDIDEATASDLREKRVSGACAIQQTSPIEPAFGYNYYYGTTHSHSNYTDGGLPTSSCSSGSPYGSGSYTPALAYEYARVSAGLDFLFVTDHNHLYEEAVSNSIPPLTEAKVRQRYQAGLAAAVSSTVDGTFVAGYGFEFGVTTNSDQGHVIVLESPTLFGWDYCTTCTGATPQCTSGSNCYFDVYVPKRYAYLTMYGRSVEHPSAYGALGILCHPGSAEFDNYAYNANADAAMQGIAVRSGLAFSTATTCSDANVASTDYFSRFKTALSKGFHVGPTAESDAHCNNYGVAVPTRTVYLLPNGSSPVLTRANLLTAHKNRHFFATEDPNLQLVFGTSDGSHIMGDIFSAASGLTMRVAVNDPNSESMSLIEIWRGQTGSVPSAAYKTASSVSTYSFTETLTSGTYYYFTHIRQADGHDAWSAPMWVTYSTSANFSLSASPTSLSVVQGNSGTSTITATPSNGFSSAVALSASGLPAGTTAAFNPTSIAGGSGSSTLTITVGSSTTAGTYAITVTGTGGGLTRTTTVSLTVTAAQTPSFALSASPTAVSVVQGSSGSSTIASTISGGFNSAVALTASGMPTGSTATFSPTSIAAPGSGTSTLTLAVGASTATGTYAITVTGTGGGLTKTTTVSLTVTAAQTPSFALTASPTSLSVVQGSSGSSTIASTISGGFNSAVALTASGMPTGSTATFSPTSIAAPGSGTSTLTLAVGASTATGTYAITVTGTGGGLTRTTSVGLTVTSSGGVVELTNNVAVTNQSAATGTWLYYRINVPSGASNLVMEISGGTGDADLYTMFGAQPTSSTYDCRPYLGGNAESCTVAAPSVGYYYLGVNAYAAFSGLTVKASYTTGGGGGTELVTNGDFETGTASPWVFATYSSITTGTPQAGTYKAQQLGRGTTTSTNFYQPIAGFNGATKTLTFYLKISSAEGTTTAYDYLYVRIKNTAGTTVSTLGTYSNKNKTTYANWVLVTLTVPTSALANYSISFDATEDSSLQTTFFIDSVSIK